MSKDKEIMGASISKPDKRRTVNQPNSLSLVYPNTEIIGKNENFITTSSLFAAISPLRTHQLS